MSSTFSRLFLYAKTSEVESKENFTTEALAAAMRTDPAPFFRALGGLGVGLNGVPAGEVMVRTQVPVAGTGFIDLVVDLSEKGRWIAAVWVEVKVDAGESGTQITNYQTWIARSTDTLRPTLVILSKHRLRSHPTVPWLPWQALRREGAQSGSLYWQDLIHWLKEIHMADEYDEPIRDVEAATLLGAHSLYRKASRLIWTMSEARKDSGDDRDSWRALGWPLTAADVEKKVLEDFGWSSRFGYPLTTGRPPIRIYLGIVQVDESADFHQPEPHIAVWIEHPPRRTDLREELRAQAAAGGLGVHWERRSQGWWGLTAHERISAFEGHDAVAAWMLERFRELDDAGLLAYLSASSGSLLGDIEASEADDRPSGLDA